MLGPLERYMTPTLDAALLCSSRAGSDLGSRLDWLRSFCQLGFLIPQVELQCFSKAREKAVLFEDPSLQFQDEFVQGIRYNATDKAGI